MGKKHFVAVFKTGETIQYCNLEIKRHEVEGNIISVFGPDDELIGWFDLGYIELFYVSGG